MCSQSCQKAELPQYCFIECMETGNINLNAGPKTSSKTSSTNTTSVDCESVGKKTSSL